MSKIKEGDYIYNVEYGHEWKVMSYNEETSQYECECTKEADRGGFEVGETCYWYIFNKDGSLNGLWTLGRHPDNTTKSKLKEGSYFYDEIGGDEWKVLSYDEDAGFYICECTCGAHDGLWAVGDTNSWYIFDEDYGLNSMWTLGRLPSNLSTNSPDNPTNTSTETDNS